MRPIFIRKDGQDVSELYPVATEKFAGTSHDETRETNYVNDYASDECQGDNNIAHAVKYIHGQKRFLLR